MLARKIVDKQLSRLSGLDFAPRGENAVDAITEVRTALAASAISEEQAKRILDLWLAEHVEYPKPADIYTLGQQVRQQAVNDSAPRGCERCHGTGYHSFVRRVQAYRGEFGTYEAECCEHCTCPLGVWRAQKHAERRAEAAK
jgi:hypothetical protein